MTDDNEVVWKEARSAKTGRFVKMARALKRPARTVVQTMRRKRK